LEAIFRSASSISGRLSRAVSSLLPGMSCPAIVNGTQTSKPSATMLPLNFSGATPTIVNTTSFNRSVCPRTVGLPPNRVCQYE